MLSTNGMNIVTLFSMYKMFFIILCEDVGQAQLVTARGEGWVIFLNHWPIHRSDD